jgi:tetratricopeptide (TPR) repeat protein
MDGVKRVLAGLFLLGLSAAGVYGYTLSERERIYRQKIADGDAALAVDNNTGAANEAFSGAIAIKDDSMVGYLKRGQTYRRRGEFVAAIRDLRRAAEIDPSATRPLEELGDAYMADTPPRYGTAAEKFEAYVKLDNRAPRILYKLAFARYHEGETDAAIDALQRAIAGDERFAEAYYLLGLCQRDAQHPELARRALDKSIELQPALLHAREELADLYGALGRTESRLTQLVALNALDPGVSREVTLGLAYAHSGQENLAVTTLGRAAQRYPDYPYAYVRWTEARNLSAFLDLVASGLVRVDPLIERAVQGKAMEKVPFPVDEFLELPRAFPSGSQELAERKLQKSLLKSCDALVFHKLSGV